MSINKDFISKNWFWGIEKKKKLVDNWCFGLLVARYHKPKDENMKWTGHKSCAGLVWLQKIVWPQRACVAVRFTRVRWWSGWLKILWNWSNLCVNQCCFKWNSSIIKVWLRNCEVILGILWILYKIHFWNQNALKLNYCS